MANNYPPGVTGNEPEIAGSNDEVIGYCPDCGKRTLELIEETAQDADGQYKRIGTCPGCDNLVYLIRQGQTEE
jgi:hypothetical protein